MFFARRLVPGVAVAMSRAGKWMALRPDARVVFCRQNANGGRPTVSAHVAIPNIAGLFSSIFQQVIATGEVSEEGVLHGRAFAGDNCEQLVVTEVVVDQP